ncbi:DUF1963 domain-containing protein [Streptomyces sp. ITFR-16]|uniref:DUF1963 domain-containing protein n=1 Tax=Streptomyces sp. ITFR-16 TaxID=3075198 RepID=UPI0028894EAE|nr:DUF1963 domain-containing protein [Streptomyces sp. ITFR-16]WNI23240.1 DUF1963 domain-containing protein [Streptomyces sp. ITFR-16]
MSDAAGGSRTTPPRPLDVEALFPEVAAFRKETVRLHPRAGNPGPGDSSMGGPVRWPRAEAWPHCEDDHPRTDLAPAKGSGPLPLVPVLQLYAADVPELPFPAGTDVLQVLWCPFDHEAGYVPRPELYWRDSSACDEEPAVPPRPEGAPDDYLPDPCVLHPERVTEYPNWDLPDDIAEPLEERFEEIEEETGWSYWSHLSVASGAKAGGYPTWTQDPHWPDCPACGHRMDHLLTINSAEFDGESWRTWLPVEDMPATGTVLDLPYEERSRVQRAPGLMLGDMGGLYLFVCPHCPDRPYACHADCS